MHLVAEKFLMEIPAWAERRRAGEIDDAVFAAAYFIFWQIARHGKNFAARKRKSDERPDADDWLALLETAQGEVLRTSLIDGFNRYQFRGIIDNVPVALVHWLQNAWPLILREDIPTPREVLGMQARGVRAVTALAGWPRMMRPVLRKPDAFAFFVHDLEHAWKFFHSPALCAAQRNFFSALERAHDRGIFTPCLDDAEFTGRFHYLMSDMNTHPEHARQYLRAILVELYLRREGKGPAEALSAAAELDIVTVLRALGGAMAPDGARDAALPSRRARSPAPLSPDWA